MLKRGAGLLSVQSGDILYSVSESDVDVLLNRDDVGQSASSAGHDAAVHQEVQPIVDHALNL